MPMFSFVIQGPGECGKCGGSLEDREALSVADRHKGHVGEYGYILEHETGACLMLSGGDPTIVCEKCLHDISKQFRVLDET